MFATCMRLVRLCHLRCVWAIAVFTLGRYLGSWRVRSVTCASVLDALALLGRWIWNPPTQRPCIRYLQVEWNSIGAMNRMIHGVFTLWAIDKWHFLGLGRDMWRLKPRSSGYVGR